MNHKEEEPTQGDTLPFNPTSLESTCVFPSYEYLYYAPIIS